MNAIMFFVILAFLATIVMLFAGGVSMARGGKYDFEHAEELMSGRLLLHALTLALIAIAVFAWN